MTDILSQFDAERDDLGERLLTAIRDAMPWDMVIDLGLERSAVVAKLGQSRVFRQPIYPPGTMPVAGEVDPIGYGPWQFIFDFRLHNCDQDHIEVCVKVSGGGGFA